MIRCWFAILTPSSIHWLCGWYFSTFVVGDIESKNLLNDKFGGNEKSYDMTGEGEETNKRVNERSLHYLVRFRALSYESCVTANRQFCVYYCYNHYVENNEFISSS